MKTKGYTLIEVLIVIAIIAVLSAVMLSVNFSQQLKKARDGKRKANIEQIRSALEMCRTDTGSYPASLDVVSCGGVLTCGGNTYLSPIPCDPKNSGTYIYTYSGSATTYTLSANLEMGGIYTSTPLGSQ